MMRKYWGPVFFFVRRYWTRDVDKAKDLTQAFFLAFLEKDFLASVDAEKGRFRTFVCAALKNFLRNERRAERAKKRRPEGQLLSLEDLVVEDRDFDVEADPTEAFDDDWRRATLEAALTAVRALARAAGKEVFVQAFVEAYLEGEEGKRPSYDELGRRFDLSYHQVKNGLAWVRERFAACLRREVEEQVSSPEDLREEAGALGLELE